jgi:hypothetical protein
MEDRPVEQFFEQLQLSTVDDAGTELETPVDPDYNPQVILMSEQLLRDVPVKGYPPDAFQYGDPVRDAVWFKKRCEQLNMHFPDYAYDIMALHEAGIRRKQFRSMLKKAKKKQVCQIKRQRTIVEF